MKLYNVGKIVNTHGVRGEVRVISKTDFPEERYTLGNTLYIEKGKGDQVKVTVASHRQHKSFDLLTFKEFHNINEVEQFKGCLLQVTEDQLVELEEDEFYYHEIIGCIVFSEEGEEIGKVGEIIETGANDVWVLKRKGKKDALIPYIESIVKEIDVEEKKIIIHLMEGLIE
ncbi:MAG: ribosome maturation factor RimM [Bacillaceae bacterium]